MLNKLRRNLIYFIIITLASGWLGVLVDRILTKQPNGNSLGMGIWLTLPLLCAVIFRIREKEWKSFGLTLNIKYGWKGYVIAIFIYPTIIVVTTLLAMCLGCVKFSMNSWSAFLSVAVAALAGSFVKNIFEEFAWRGYLTPRLLGCKLNDWFIYGISGLIWGLWHAAYYLVFLGDEYFVTSSRLETLISGCFVMVVWSILFVEIYRMTKSVWACVILHSMEEMTSTILATAGVFEKYSGWGQMLFNPITGIFSLIIIAGVGLFLRKERIYQQTKEMEASILMLKESIPESSKEDRVA